MEARMVGCVAWKERKAGTGLDCSPTVSVVGYFSCMIVLPQLPQLDETCGMTEGPESRIEELYWPVKACTACIDSRLSGISIQCHSLKYTMGIKLIS